MKIYSTSLAVRYIQIKTIINYHYRFIKMAKINYYSKNTKFWQECNKIE